MVTIVSVFPITYPLVGNVVAESFDKKPNFFPTNITRDIHNFHNFFTHMCSFQ